MGFEAVVLTVPQLAIRITLRRTRGMKAVGALSQRSVTQTVRRALKQELKGKRVRVMSWTRYNEFIKRWEGYLIYEGKKRRWLLKQFSLGRGRLSC